jgi:hypothetical protein
MSTKPLGQTTSLIRDFDEDGSWLTLMTIPGPPNTYSEEGYPASNLYLNPNNNKLYYTGYQMPSSGSDAKWTVCSFNSNGTTEYQKTLDWIQSGASATFDYSTIVVTHPTTNDIYLGGTGTPNYLPQFYRLNSSLSSVLDSREMGGPYTGGNLKGIHFDSSGNIYILGTSYLSGGAYDVFLQKFDSSYNLQWKRKITTSNQDWSWCELKVDISGNIYVLINTDTFVSTTTSMATLLKYNSSGTLQWQRKIATSSTSPTRYTIGQDLAIDSSLNIFTIYTVTSETNASYFDVHIMKHNSSGVLQWQKQVQGLLFAGKEAQIVVDSNDLIYISFQGYERTMQKGEGPYAVPSHVIMNIDTGAEIVAQKTISQLITLSSYYSLFPFGMTISGNNLYFASRYEYQPDGSNLHMDIIFGKISKDLNKNNGYYKFNNSQILILEPGHTDVGETSYFLTNSSLYEGAGTMTDSTPSSGEMVFQSTSVYNYAQFTIGNQSLSTVTIQ